jgi:hypothetical protein
MDKEVKELQSENVRYKTRIAAGAWLNGEQMKEESKATMPEANSDHGDFHTSSIEKSNS